MTRNEPLLESFAAELRARRTKLGLSQEALAFRAEVNRNYVAKLALAQNQPSLSVMLNLSSALEIDLRDFVGGVLVRYQRAKRAVGKGSKRRDPSHDTCSATRSIVASKLKLSRLIFDQTSFMATPSPPVPAP